MLSLSPWHAGPERADVANDELDLGSGLRCVVELLDDRLVRERVHLDPDPALLAGRGGLGDRADLVDQPRAKCPRRDEQLAEPLGPPEPGQVVEEVGDVRGDLRVRGEEAEILVAASVHRVVVPGPDVGVTPQHVAFPPDHERRLRMDLQVREPIDDVHARALERPRPLDVAVLVEPSLELDQAHGLLPVLGRLDERRDERRLVARAIDGGLQSGDVGIGGGAADERLEAGGERFVGVVDEEVASPDLVEELGGRVDLGKPSAASPGARGRPSSRAGRGARAPSCLRGRGAP